jgi:hypothetical protein
MKHGHVELVHNLHHQLVMVTLPETGKHHQLFVELVANVETSTFVCHGKAQHLNSCGLDTNTS